MKKLPKSENRLPVQAPSPGGGIERPAGVLPFTYGFGKAEPVELDALPLSVRREAEQLVYGITGQPLDSGWGSFCLPPVVQKPPGVAPFEELRAWAVGPQGVILIRATQAGSYVQSNRGVDFAPGTQNRWTTTVVVHPANQFPIFHQWIDSTSPETEDRRYGRWYGGKQDETWIRLPLVIRQFLEEGVPFGKPNHEEGTFPRLQHWNGTAVQTMYLDRRTPDIVCGLYLRRSMVMPAAAYNDTSAQQLLSSYPWMVSAFAVPLAQVAHGRPMPNLPALPAPQAKGRQPTPPKAAVSPSGPKEKGISGWLRRALGPG